MNFSLKLPNIPTKLQFIKFKEFLSKLLKFFYFYLAFVGIFGFSCFIMEEGIQLISFANFSASDNRNYATITSNLDLVERINQTKRTVATWTLWLIPPQRYAYLAYADSVDRYIHTLRQEILANSPECLLNRHVSIEGFRYLSAKKLKNSAWELRNRDISVIVAEKPQGRTVSVSGILRMSDSGRLEIVTTGQ